MRWVVAYSLLNYDENIWSIPIPARPPISVSEATQVTTGNQTIEGIAVSPDGGWLAFDSNRSNQDIYRMPLGGGEIEQLTTNPADDFAPSWSPDGKEIVFQSWRNGNRDLLLMAADGSSERQPTSLPGHEYYPDWSGDGKQIVFRWQHGEQDSLAVLTRTADGAAWEAPRELVSRGGPARWSPDGSLIAYINSLDSQGLGHPPRLQRCMVQGQPDRVLQSPRWRGPLEHVGGAGGRGNSDLAGKA